MCNATQTDGPVLFRERILPTPQWPSFVLSQAFMWLLGEPIGRELGQLNCFFNKVYCYSDEFPHPVLMNSCAGRRDEIVQDLKQVVEEESGWDWFLWKHYLLISKVFMELQALCSFTSYSTPSKYQVLSLATAFKIWNTRKWSKVYTANKQGCFWEMGWK